MDLEISALRCFMAAIRTGSMSRAAPALGRTQPAVSQQIRRLEDVLAARSCGASRRAWYRRRKVNR